MSSTKTLDDVARWLGTEWSEGQRAMFVRYQSWLLDEAMPAGGIGPGEAHRIFDRHIADSLVFAKLIQNEARTLVDVGSGVGLPGIPIAIACPHIAVTLVDRSERRAGLASRACRILELDRVVVSTSDAADIDETFDIITFRASLSLDRATKVFDRLAGSSGEGLFALSRVQAPIAPLKAPEHTIFTIMSEGLEVLDSPAWMLRMQRRQST
ncbi:MAG: hypothetical protein BMS9Abin12_0841 [Acidimicrobiia bacterium]|nr:MAG: hypothetical protein BMS9Abin12_0841 [Acidimicrobiia bacterium]